MPKTKWPLLIKSGKAHISFIHQKRIFSCWMAYMTLINTKQTITSWKRPKLRHQETEISHYVLIASSSCFCLRKYMTYFLHISSFVTMRFLFNKRLLAKVNFAPDGWLASKWKMKHQKDTVTFSTCLKI